MFKQNENILQHKRGFGLLKEKWLSFRRTKRGEISRGSTPDLRLKTLAGSCFRNPVGAGRTTPDLRTKQQAVLRLICPLLWQGGELARLLKFVHLCVWVQNLS
ncbi:MAG TPA: hypothetical protein ENH02_08270 [Bacteroidetes bacterium]|nr:hypothetical protein [Bacteroidota bacterium]